MDGHNFFFSPRNKCNISGDKVEAVIAILGLKILLRTFEPAVLAVDLPLFVGG